MDRNVWKSEKIFFDGNQYFDHLCSDLKKAKKSIDLESYIFRSDHLGEKIFSLLVSARSRGVAVRVIVDGVGSPGWRFHFRDQCRESGIRFRIYHPMPWDSVYLRKWLSFKRWVRRLFVLIYSFNRRDHRKLVLIDRKIAWLGSYNITTDHLKRGRARWRDSGVRLEGHQLYRLRRIFEHTWRNRIWKIKKNWVGVLSRGIRSSLVRFNSGWRIRRFFYHDLITRISCSKKYVWITTAYFVPTRKLLKALILAKKNQSDVRILLPHRSDVFFMPWISRTFYYLMMSHGIRIFEYRAGILHAKSILVDQTVILGSSNLNSRSLLRDLEVDVFLKKPKSLELMKTQYKKDLESSREITFRASADRSIFERLLVLPFLLLKRWL